jgi:predicted nucleic acid-binding Zn ribbon protein
MSDDPLKVCPKCQGKLTKVLYPTGIVFKGSGFYKTDYKSSGEAASTNGSSTAGESKSESKVESKPESKSDSSD